MSWGGWVEIERTELPETEILTSYYGDPETVVSVWGNSAYVYFRKVGTTTSRLEFLSGAFDLNKIDLVELLRKLHALSPSFWAKTTRVVSRNRFPDDCLDIPANTLQIETIYSLEILLDNGERQGFQAMESSFDPPMNTERSIQ